MTHIDAATHAISIHKKRLVDILEKYTEQLKANCREICETTAALDACEWKSAERVAHLFFIVHRLAGSSGTMGFDQLSEIAIDAERLLAPFRDCTERDPLPEHSLVKDVRRKICRICFAGQTTRIEDSRLYTKI